MQNGKSSPCGCSLWFGTTARYWFVILICRTSRAVVYECLTHINWLDLECTTNNLQPMCSLWRVHHTACNPSTHHSYSSPAFQLRERQHVEPSHPTHLNLGIFCCIPAQQCLECHLPAGDSCKCKPPPGNATTTKSHCITLQSSRMWWDKIGKFFYGRRQIITAQSWGVMLWYLPTKKTIMEHCGSGDVTGESQQRSWCSLFSSS